MARLLQLSVLAASLSMPTFASAQVMHMVPPGLGGGGGVGNGNLGAAALGGLAGAAYWNSWGGNPFGSYGGSTPYGDFARGDAAILRAMGENAYLNSLANVNNQDAYEHFLQNDRMRVEVYFAKKQTWDSWRATQRDARPTPEQLARWADQQRPDRLAASQIAADSGKITWPTLLTATEFAESRARLDALFAQRAKGTPDAHFVGDVRDSISAMRTVLLNQMATLPPMEYLQVDKFLDSLHYESYFLPERPAAAE